MKRKIGIFTTHPIQYQVPLFRSLGREKNIDAHIFYASNHGIKPKMDKDFNKKFAWDTDMVSGYKYKIIGSNKNDVNNSSTISSFSSSKNDDKSRMSLYADASP